MKNIKDLINDIVSEISDKEDGGLDIVKIIIKRRLQEHIDEVKPYTNYHETYNDIFWRVIYELQNRKELARIIASECPTYYVVYRYEDDVTICAVMQTFASACEQARSVAEDYLLEVAQLSVDEFRDVYRQCGGYIAFTETRDEDESAYVAIVNRERIYHYERSTAFNVIWS